MSESGSESDSEKEFSFQGLLDWTENISASSRFLPSFPIFSCFYLGAKINLLLAIQNLCHVQLHLSVSDLKYKTHINDVPSFIQFSIH